MDDVEECAFGRWRGAAVGIDGSVTVREVRDHGGGDDGEDGLFAPFILIGHVSEWRRS